MVGPNLGAAQTGQPRIDASLTNDFVRAVDFPPNTSVSFEIYASPGGALLFGPATRTTDGTGSVYLNREEHSVDLVAGIHAVVSDGTTTKAVTLAALTIDSVDAGTNVVSGTAPPNTTVSVFATDEFSNIPASLDTTADGTGA